MARNFLLIDNASNNTRNVTTTKLPVLFLPCEKVKYIVRFKYDPNSKWEKAKVGQAHVTPRSYIIEAKDGVQYRRNRRHLRRTSEPPLDTTEAQIENFMPTYKASHEQARETNHPKTTIGEAPKRSRYGCLINQNPNYKT
jgi:hypothetical protein